MTTMNAIYRSTLALAVIALMAFSATGARAQLLFERTVTPNRTIGDNSTFNSSLIWANPGVTTISNVWVTVNMSSPFVSNPMRLGDLSAQLSFGLSPESVRTASLFTTNNSTASSLSQQYFLPTQFDGGWLASNRWNLQVTDHQGGGISRLDSWKLTVESDAPVSGTLNVGSGGEIAVVGAGTQTIGAIVESTGTGNNAVRLTPTDGQKIVVSGGLSGGGDFRKQGGGAICLDGNSTNFTGRVLVEEGEVQLASGTALGSAGRLEIAGSNAIVRLVNSAIISNAMVLTNGATARLDGEGKFAGGISGNGRVVKEGASTVTIAGDNTYTGETEVAAGKLVVNGTLASSNVVVRSNSILGGSGTLGALTLEQGATIQPGNSPGTINFTNTQTWNPGASYNWQIYDALGTAGSPQGWSLISITNNGSLNLSSLSSTNRFNLNLWSLSGINPDVNGVATNFSSTGAYTWRILYAQGGITDWSADKFNINWFATNGTGGFAGVSGGNLFSLAADANNIYLSYGALGAPIPEPGTWAAALLLAGAAGYVQWRRRSSLRQNSAPR